MSHNIEKIYLNVRSDKRKDVFTGIRCKHCYGHLCEGDPVGLYKDDKLDILYFCSDKCISKFAERRGEPFNIKNLDREHLDPVENRYDILDFHNG